MSLTGAHATANRVRKSPAAFLSAIFRAFLAWPSWKALSCIYLLFSLARIALAFAATNTPVIMPDSALYLHLSRSIFEQGELLFRGQPIRYAYTLYPLLLSPLHLLPDNISLFRAAQVLNALTMHLAIFPAYSLARAITKSHHRGLAAAFLTMLMPDFLMAEHIMAESLAFPLILAACHSFYKRYDDPPSFGGAVMWGFLGFLLYALKPGYAALPACFFALLLIESLRTRNPARLYKALAPALVMAAFLGLYTLLLRYGLHMSTEQSSLYGSQTHPLTFSHLLQTFNGLVMYGAFVPLAFGFLPLYLPAANLRAYEERDRRFLQTVLLSVLILILGTVYVIYYDELQGGDPYSARIHVRYVSAFLPVLMAFMLSPTLNGKRMNTKLFALLSFSFLCFIRWDGSALVSGYSYPVDALLLTAATVKGQSFNGGLLWPMAAMLFLAAMAFRLFKNGFGAKESRALCAFLAFAFLLNGTLAFALYRHHSGTTLPGEAREALELSGTAGTLGVVRDGACFWPEAAELDVVSRCTLPVVELDDLIAHANDDGTLSAFVPSAYWQESAVNEIPAPQRLILFGDILYAVVLAGDTASSAVSTSQKGYVVADVLPGSPWIHSGLSGLNQGWVQAGSRFTLFDAQLLQKGQITLRLQCRAGEGQEILTLRCGGQEKSYALTAELGWIDDTFTVEDPSKPLAVTLESSGSVLIQTYLVE